MTLSPEEHKLFVETAYHLADEIWHGALAVSAHEEAQLIAVHLGLFETTGSGAPKPAMPRDEVRAHLATISPSEACPLERIIGCFLSLKITQRGEISDEKVPFEAPGRLQQAMWAFVMLDYATREQGGFAWTDKIAPIMQAEALWCRETGESFTTIYRHEAARLTEQIWSAMSVWRRHALARWIAGKSEMDVYAYLFTRWDGARLSLFRLPEDKRPWYRQFEGAEVATREIFKRLIGIRQRHPF